MSTAKLATLLRDRYYLGVVIYQGAEYPGRHEPLTDLDTFEKVQAILDASGVAGERRRSRDHHLKGTLWCARCHARGRPLPTDTQGPNFSCDRNSGNSRAGGGADTPRS